MKSLRFFTGKGKPFFFIIMMIVLLAPARMMGQESCEPPTDFHMVEGSLTPNSITFDWTPVGNETTWKIRYYDYDSYSETVIDGITEHPYTVTGLQVNTGYYSAQVCAVCEEGDVSEWEGWYEFTTPFCDPADQCALHYELKSNGWGWDGQYIGVYYKPTVDEMVLVSELYLYGSYAEGDLFLCDGGTYDFVWNVGYLGSLDDCSFVIYDALGEPVLNYAAGEAPGSEYDDYEDMTLLEDYVFHCPTCEKPWDFSVETTSRSATFTWDAESEQSSWQFQYSTDKTNWSDLQTVTETEYSIDNQLTPATLYYARVRSVCGVGDYSVWVKLFFYTDCETVHVDAEHSYTENFDDIRGWGYYDESQYNILPLCWNYLNTSDNYYDMNYPTLYGEHAYYDNIEGGEYKSGEGVYSYSYPTYLRFAANNSACEQYAILPAMTNVNGLELKFMTRRADYDIYFENVLHVGVMTDPTDASTYTEIQSYLLSIPVYEELYVYFDKYELQQDIDEYYIAFKVDVPENYPYDIHIDNVSVSVLPTCLAPYELAVSNVQENDVTLTWTPNGDETAWQVRYSSDRSNWTIVDFTEDNPGQTVSKLLANLGHNTLYYVQVRANCGDGFSEWSRENSFRTTCSSDYQDVPYYEDFDSYIAFDDRMPQCWDYINSSNSTQYPTNQSYPVISNGVEGYFANNYMYFRIAYYDYLNYHYGMDPQDQYTLLPRMENVGNLQMRFSGMGEANNYWTDYNCQVKVGVFDDNGTFHLISTINTNRQRFTSYLVSFDGYEGAGRIAFLVEPPQQFGSRCYTSLVKIDNVSVTPKISYKRFIADGNWNEPSCWENGEMPTSASDNVLIRAAAVIPSGCSVDVNVIEFDGNVASLTIEDGGQLKHNNSGLQAVVKKHIEPYSEELNDKWNLIAMPIMEEKDVYYVTNMGSGEYDLYYFDQNCNDSEWQNYEDYQNGWYSIVPKKGYLYANADEVTMEFSGTLFPTNVDQTVSLDYIEGKSWKGWNLIGNPFACQAYLANGMTYYRMNTEGTAFESTQAGTPIASMEGVFVKATGSGQTAVFTTTPQRSNGQMNIRLSHGQNYVDNAIIGFGDGNTLLKAMFNPNASKVYFAEDKGDYSIIRVGKSGEQALNFKASENGSYTLTFSLDDVELSYLHLIDNLTGADVDLLALRQAQRPAEYTFDARTTDYACRFKLVFNANMTTGSDNFAFFNGSEWIVSNMGEATLQVVDMLGRILVSETINGNASISISETPGVYVMRLVNGNEVRTQKIVVQ